MRPPTFSVIVPSYRRPRQLAACLESLERQAYPATDYEVIVVDDAAMRADLEPITSTARRYICRLLSQKRRGAAAARNAGAEVARGRLLAFTDDDCEPDPSWLTALERALGEQHERALVGGRVVNALPDDPFASATQALVDFVGEAFNAEPGRARLLTSNNLAVATAAFRDLGGFDTTFTGAGGEDRELCLRWLHHGYPAVYRAEALVHHAHELTLGGFVRQHFAYGAGAARLRRQAQIHGYGPLPLEPTAFYLNLLRSHAGLAERRRRIGRAALLVLSQAANAAGYFRARATTATRATP
jgi:GT2 family glycosyltransferase